MFGALEGGSALTTDETATSRISAAVTCVKTWKLKLINEKIEIQEVLYKLAI